MAYLISESCTISAEYYGFRDPRPRIRLTRALQAAPMTALRPAGNLKFTCGDGYDSTRGSDQDACPHKRRIKAAVDGMLSAHQSQSLAF